MRLVPKDCINVLHQIITFTAFKTKTCTIFSEKKRLK